MLGSLEAYRRVARTIAPGPDRLSASYFVGPYGRQFRRVRGVVGSTRTRIHTRPRATIPHGPERQGRPVPPRVRGGSHEDKLRILWCELRRQTPDSFLQVPT